MDTAHTTSTAGALAEQAHLIAEINQPGIEAAFERLAADHAPTVTWDELNQHEKWIIDRQLAFTAPGTPGYKRLFGDNA